MDFTGDQITIIAASISALVGGLATYFGLRFKKGKSDVKELLEANAEFRDEVRADLKAAKQELNDALERIRQLEKQGVEKDVIIRNQADRIKELEDMVSELRRR